MVVGTVAGEKGSQPPPAMPAQNHLEHGVESMPAVEEKGKMHSPAITQSFIQRDKQGLWEVLGKESTPPPAQCSRSAIGQSVAQ